MTDFRAKAEELYDSLSALIAPKSEPEMRGRDLDKIESALRAAATPPRGMVRDDQGVDRKLLGTLRITEDGHVAAEGAKVFYTYHNHWRDGSGVASLVLNHDLYDNGGEKMFADPAKAAEYLKGRTVPAPTPDPSPTGEEE